MPPASSKEQVRRSPKVGDDEFVLYLQGIPAHCRWQELKDFVRKSAMHIRQAVVYDDPCGQPTGIGQIIVKNEDEAWRTFRKLSATGWDGHALSVTLAKADAPTKPIAGPTRKYLQSANGTPNGSTVPFQHGPFAAAYAAGGGQMPLPHSPVSPVSTDSVTTQPAPGYFVNYIPACPAPTWTEAHSFPPSPAVFPCSQLEYYQYYHPTTIPMNAALPQPVSQLYPPPTAMPLDPTMFIPTVPYYYPPYKPVMYHTAAAVYPVDTNTYTLTPTCSILIDNLAPSVNMHILKSHFRRVAGTVVKHCEIVLPYTTTANNNNNNNNDDTSPNPTQPTPETRCAMATFSSPDEATMAVSRCNGTMLAGNRIMVRLHLDYYYHDAGMHSGDSGSGLIPRLRVDELEWPLDASTTAKSPALQTAPPSASSSSASQSVSASASVLGLGHLQQPLLPPSSPSSTALFSGESWNMFQSQSVPWTTSPSLSPAPSLVSSATSPTSTPTTATSSPNDDSTSPVAQRSSIEKSNNDDGDDDESTNDSSSSPCFRRDSGKELTRQAKESQKTTGTESADSRKQEPLVINGSMTGRSYLQTT